MVLKNMPSAFLSYESNTDVSVIGNSFSNAATQHATYDLEPAQRDAAIREIMLEGMSTQAKVSLLAAAKGQSLSNIIDANSEALSRAFFAGGQLRGKTRDHVQGVAAMIERNGGDAHDVKAMLATTSTGARARYSPGHDLEPDDTAGRRPSLGAPKPGWVM